MGWVLPVGIPAGVNFGLSGVPAGSGMVRVGNDVLVVPPVLYDVWLAAAHFPDWDELLHWSKKSDVSDIEGQVSALRGAGMLIVESPAAASQIGPLAISLTGECLGNTAENQAEFSVLGRGGAEIRLDLRLHEILVRSDGIASVTSICQMLEDSSPNLVQARSVEVVARSLPVLVRYGVARVDRPSR
jgi:hypothetical protein